MKLLFDVGHPAHVHFFKNFIWEMKKRGHEILITASKKDIALELLEKLGFDYIFTCKRYGGVKFGYELIKRDIQMFNLVRKCKPDVITGIHSTIITKKKRKT
jgi:predicted glycosyltransferase